VQGKRKTTAKLLPIWGKGKRVFAARTFIPSLIHSFIHALIHLFIHGDGVGVARGAGQGGQGSSAVGQTFGKHC